MKQSPLRFFAAILLLLLLAAPELRAQAAPDQAFQQALELQNQGQTQQAADAFAKVLTDYPTSTVVPEAQFRLGYLYYVLGEFDKALEILRKILGPPAPEQIQELAQGLVPQTIAAKASGLPTDDAKRKPLFEEAIKEFNTFLQKYPQSEEIETANYGRSLAFYQIERYDEAVEALRFNLQRFASSESILDSQYLLALTLATQAANSAKDGQIDPAAAAKYDEAEKLLRDIVQKRTDVALANDAQFQLGEILFNRAALSPEDRRAEPFQQAMTAYRNVNPKPDMVEAQKKRLAGILDRIRAAGAARNTQLLTRLQRLQEREQAKMAAIENKPDQTVTAQIKVGQIFFQIGRFDETRVLLNHTAPRAEGDEQKKPILYYTAMSYASQGVIDKAVEHYERFKQEYGADPMAENLPLVMGVMFLQADQPAKAVEYLDEELKLYPDGRFTIDTLTQKSAALVGLGRFDDALQSFQTILETKPRKDIAAAAEFGIASIQKETGKIDEALAGFRKVQEEYPGTQQAEQSAYWVAQLTFQKADVKAAIELFQKFIADNPDSQLVSAAMFGLGQAQMQAGQNDAALATFKQVGEKFPASQAAPYAYFQRATIYATGQKVEEMVGVMREFIEKYPQDEKVFYAYDSIGQSQINTGQPDAAIETYAAMVEKLPDNPQAPQALLKVAQLRRDAANAQGRYLALNEEQRATWEKYLEGSIEASESLLQKYPESPEVALALGTLLEDQRLLVSAQKKDAAAVEKYFRDLAGEFAAQPTTKSKILFTLASYLHEQDAEKALALMKEAYVRELVYAPADIDLFGSTLIEKRELDPAMAVYDKLAQDYPIPQGVDPQNAPPQIMEAQAIVLYGRGKVLQEEGQTAEAAKLFDRLKALYPWSPKILEANYGIAQSLFEQKKYDEAIAILVPLIRAPAATAELRANSMLLGGRIQEAQGNLDAAIDYYGKIATYYEGVPPAAAEGLQKAGELIEKQVANIADANKKKAQLTKAIKYYRDLIQKYPTSPFVEKARARLQALGAAQ